MSFARLHPAFFVGLSLLIAAAPGHAFFEKGEKSEPPRLCVVNKLDASGCKPGDNIYFKPDYFGNEQLPVEFAAMFCDLSKPVAMTTGGVACTYVGQKKIVFGPAEAQK